MTRRTGNLPYQVDEPRGPKPPFREPSSDADQLARITHYSGRVEDQPVETLIDKMYPRHDL